jgi:formylglycine-generating enzyme required for sulfatase activity
MELVRIEPGRFMMGSPASEPGRFDGEAQHEVTISKAFWLGQTEVTQAQWEAVMGSNPSWFDLDPRMPVDRVSWTDADEFCRRLSKRTGMTFRLPTEAEWEYACRAGTTTAYSFGDDPMALKEFGWVGGTEAEPGNADGRPHPVGSLRPNPWGLYDLHGNLFEWCADRWAAYPDGPVTDPQGPPDGMSLYRGGSWLLYSRFCRAAMRYSGLRFGGDVYGFRVARTP